MQQTCGQVEYKNWDGEPKGSPGQPKSMQVWLADLRTSLDTSFSDGLGWFVHFPRMQVSPSIKLEWWSPALDSWWRHERVKTCFPAGLGTCLMSREWVIPLLFLVLSCWQASRLFVLGGGREFWRNEVQREMRIVGTGRGLPRTGSPENLEVVCVWCDPLRRNGTGDSCFFSAALTALHA